MLGGACDEREGEKCARSVDRRMATVRSCIRGDHRFYAAPVGVCRLFFSAGSVVDDPVLGSMGGAFHFSGDRDLSIV